MRLNSRAQECTNAAIEFVYNYPTAVNKRNHCNLIAALEIRFIYQSVKCLEIVQQNRYLYVDLYHLWIVGESFQSEEVSLDLVCAQTARVEYERDGAIMAAIGSHWSRWSRFAALQQRTALHCDSECVSDLRIRFKAINP